MASLEERNARLDKLQSAVDAWAEKETKRLTAEAALLKKVLKGRTGSERLNDSTVQSASTLLVEELNDFLTGD